MAEIEDLASTQRWLASLILDPAKVRSANEEAASRLTIANPTIRAERLSAYVNGYPARIFDALGDAFPAIKHVVGGHAFAEMTNRYRAHLPAGIYGLDAVGTNLPEFLRGDPLAEDYEFVPDLAELEQAVQRAFHSHERAPFDATTAAGWTLEDWSTVVVEFQPSVATVSSDWPILDVWRARETPLDEIDIDLRERPQNVLVYRSGLRVCCDAVERAESAALEVLTTGRELGVAMQILAGNGLEPQSVSSLFARLTQQGLVVACRTAAS